MNNLYNFLNPKNNDYISNFNDRDLLEFITLLKDFKPILREKINANKNLKFGIEIEYDEAPNKNEIERLTMKNFPLWTHKEDGSLSPKGAEISSPILTDNSKSWHEINKVCNLLYNMEACANDNCGAHTNYNFDYFNKVDNFINYLLLHQAFENIIFRFGYQNTSQRRNAIELFSHPIAKELNKINLNKLRNLPLKDVKEQITRKINRCIYIDLPIDYCINFNKAESIHKFSKDNLLEIRNKNGTINPIQWQTGILFDIGQLDYSKSKNFDLDEIEKIKLINQKHFSDFYYYRQINLEQIIKFADLICKNNEDKFYIIHQYLFKEDEKLNFSNIAIKNKKLILK